MIRPVIAVSSNHHTKGFREKNFRNSNVMRRELRLRVVQEGRGSPLGGCALMRIRYMARLTAEHFSEEDQVRGAPRIGTSHVNGNQ
jgi:hypothetical protein